MSEPFTVRPMPQSDGTHAALFGPWFLKSAYQPVFDLSSGRAVIAGFEALVRPFIAGHAATPARLFANTSGENRRTLETLTRDLHIANAKTLPVQGGILLINIDPSAFADRLEIAEAINSVRRQWSKTGAPAQQLVCEITEKKAKSPVLLFALADAIRANGFRLAVDDFGSDNSDVERLAKLKPDLVKFDGPWLKGLMATHSGYAHIKSMTQRFAGLGIETVFEGIEHLWQLELCETAGATYVQGHALAGAEIAPTSFGRFGKPDKLGDARARLVREAVSGNANVSLKPTFGLKIA